MEDPNPKFGSYRDHTHSELERGWRGVCGKNGSEATLICLLRTVAHIFVASDYRVSVNGNHMRIRGGNGRLSLSGIAKQPQVLKFQVAENQEV